MNLADSDFFELWRLLLATICGIYATIVTLRSAWRWLRYFSGSDQTTKLMRSYALVQLLRLRWHRFSKDLFAIGTYLLILVWVMYFHQTG